MAPKPSTKAPKASTSKQPAPAPKPSRKRRSQEEEEAASAFASVDSLGLGPQALEFGSDDDEEDDAAVMDGESDDEPEEAFPEVDFGESDEDEDGSFAGEEDANDDDEDVSEDEKELDTDDEAALLAELEAEEAEALAASSEDDGSDLDELIRRHTTKPNEDETPSTSWEQDPTLPKDYMKRSRTVTSAITGVEKTQWDEEIDAGYGSDSSTEEVSLRITSYGIVLSAADLVSFSFILDHQPHRQHPRLLLRRHASHRLRH